MKEPLVYFIIPVHNSWSYTQQCLQSLGKIKYKNYKVIIINDGSTDKTAANLKKYYPRMIELKGNGNLWDSGCRNKAVKSLLRKNVSPQYILSCNNDIIFHSDFLNKLIKFSQTQEDRCILGPKILKARDKKKIFHFGTKLNSAIAKLELIDKDQQDGSRFNQSKQVDNLTGMCLLIPFKVFRKHKIFWDAKRFPMYLGDSDFVLKAKKADFKPWIVAKSKIYAFPQHSVALQFNQLNFINSLKFVFSPRSNLSPFLAAKFFYQHFGWKLALRAFVRKSKTLCLLLKKKIKIKF